MKTVFSNDQVAHVWAQQNQDEGQNGKRTLWFHGDTIYSYGKHYPIARFTSAVVPSMPTERIVLFNSNGSTPTTEGKHKHEVRAALHGLPVRVLYVDDPRADRERHHRGNLADMRSRYDTLLAEAGRARKYGHLTLERAGTLRADANVYAAAFLNESIDWPEVSGDTAHAAREAHRVRAAELAERTRVREAATQATYNERLARWLAGESVSLYVPGLTAQQPTRLRLSSNGRTIQTSRGAEVSRKVAAGVWQLAKLHHDSATPYEGSGRDVGGFWLSGVSEAGDVKISCHTLKYAELERFAKVLKLETAKEAA